MALHWIALTITGTIPNHTVTVCHSADLNLTTGINRSALFP